VRGLAPVFYRDGEHTVSARGDGAADGANGAPAGSPRGWALTAEPAVYLAAGPALGVADSAYGRATNSVAFQASRGIHAAGHVGPLFFDTVLLENQRAAPWVQYDERSSPRLNFIKLPDGQTYDYWFATGSVGVRTRYVEARYGRERRRWGFGSGTLSLSDYAAPFDALELRTRFWRIQYTNIFGELVTPTARPRQGLPPLNPKRYAANHRLALALPGRVDLELFEHTVFADDTLNGRRSGFDFAYLNPIIFYRAVEADIGAADNVLLGMGLAWTATPGVRVYGQLLLDEFKASELGSDWWGNKYGGLVGLRLADPGVGRYRLRNVDAWGELAVQRPYLYSHRGAATGFVQGGDGLGHPAGPNSVDLAGFVRYRPAEHATVHLGGSWTRRGRNTATQNFGSDPSITYTTRVSDYGVTLLQGVRQTEWVVEGGVGYEVLPRVVVEAALSGRRLRDAELGQSSYLSTLVQLRWGLPFASQRY
jgi:hypothetical protein